MYTGQFIYVTPGWNNLKDIGNLMSKASDLGG